MKKSIFWKLLFMNLLVITVALLIIAVLLSQLVSNYIYEQKERELSAKGDEISQLFADYRIGRLDEETILYLLNSLDRFWDARIWVADRRGLVVMASYGEPHFRRGPRFTISDRQQLEKILNGETVSSRRYLRHFEETMLSVGVPIQNFGEVTGVVFLHAPVTGIEAAAGQMRYYIALAGLAAVILASIPAYIYSLRISKPLKEMSSTALKMAEGDFSRSIETSLEDEIGQLGSSLNYLSRSLQETVDILKGEKEKFESMVAGMQEGVMGVDPERRVVFFNAAATKLLELPEWSEGQPVEQLLPHPHLLQALNRALEQGELALATIISSSAVLLIHISPVKAGDGERRGAVALIRDISETEKLERMRREFIANVSHELKTPLTTIRGFAESLRDGTASDPAEKTLSLEMITGESERMGKLIEDLLDLSRLESGRLEIEKNPFPLKETAESVISRLQPLIKEKDLNITLEIPESVVVEGDSCRIEQVLRNLLENAAGFVPPGGRIYLAARRKDAGRMVEISVEDNGPGIPPDEVPYIFDRFYRVEKSRSRREGGTGLGLSIARQLVEAHGGNISAGNSPGGGAVFRFTLPAAKREL